MNENKMELENIPWEIIKSHIADPANSTLSTQHAEMLDRIFSLQRQLQRYPQPRTALALHRAKFPKISQRTAFNDLSHARELDNTYHSFNYEFYNNWMISDIIDQIQAAKGKGDLKAWAAGHANLKKAIGERPIAETDPKLLEKHVFLIQINTGGVETTLNIDDLEKLPLKTRQEMSDSLLKDISLDEAEQIMNS